MLRGALSTPTRSDDAAGVAVVGFVLTLLSWTITPLWAVSVLATPWVLLLAPAALAPLLLLRGYYVRIVADAIETGNDAGAPSFVQWGRLYRDGIKSAVLSACYLLPLAVVAVLGVLASVFVEIGRVDPDAPLPSGWGGLGGAGATAGEATLAVIGAFLVVFTAGYLLAFAYLRPAALARFAESGRLRDGLHPVAVLRTAATGDYAAGWGLAMIVLLAGYALALPFVPLFVGVAVVFTTRQVVHALYGRAAARSLGYEPAERTEATAPEADPTAEVPSRAGETPGAVSETDDPTKSSIDPEAPPTDPEVPPAVQTGRSVALRGSDILPPKAVGRSDRESEKAGYSKRAETASAGDAEGAESAGAGDAESPKAADSARQTGERAGFDWGPETRER